MRLMGFSGAAGAGKDTCVQMLVDQGWVRGAFADKMRQAVLALDPWIGGPELPHPVRLSLLVDSLGWDKAKRDHPEIRRTLQRFGTEAGRDVFGEDCWVDALMKSAWRATGPGKLAISDARFPNELAAIRNRGGVLVLVERPELEALPGAHSSETSLGGETFDVVIANDGSVEDLRAKVLAAAAMRRCRDCRLVFGPEGFQRNPQTSDGLNTYCRSCESVRMRAWREKNKARIQDKSRRDHLMSKYGITLEEYEYMLASQGGGCALCSRTAEEAQGGEGRALVVDHCHLTGRVRGVLCNRCNLGLASLESSPGWYELASDYLARA
jgi:hypothetical protein